MGFHEEGKWWVSPSNYDEEATKDLHFPKQVQFLDTTLRDGEQQPGIILTKEEKIAIAKKLDEVGVQRIEAGTPAVLKEDAEAIKAISDLGLNSKIFAFVRNMVVDMKQAKDCGVDGVIAEVPGSEHLLKFGKKWTIDKAIKAAVESTLAAKDLGLYVTFFPADSSRAGLDFLLDTMQAISEDGHMDSLVLVDTFGVLSPEGAAHRIRKMKERFPDKPIEIHCHDDFGCGLSSTIAALAAGAEVAHVTVNGIGERAGSAQLETLALTLEALYGVNTGLDTTKFKDLSKLVEETSRVAVHPSRPVVGDYIFGWETGMPSSLWTNCKDVDPLIMLPYRWDLVGQTEPVLYLGKKSGKDNLKTWLANCGLTVPEDKFDELMSKVKNKSYQLKRLINEQELRELLNSL